MPSGVTSNVPPVLQQKCTETADSSSKLTYSSWPIVNGKIITWKGNDTGYLWTVDETGKFIVYEHRGTANIRIKLAHQFSSAVSVNSVVYYPASDKCHGIAAAVTSVNSNDDNLVVYFSLMTCRLLKSVIIQFPITCLHNVYDGAASRSVFDALCKQFRTGWSDILLVGCQRGAAYLIQLDVVSLAEDDMLYAGRMPRFHSATRESLSYKEPTPVRPKHIIPLTKLFISDKLFTYHADDGRKVCLDRDIVYVSTINYLEKSKSVMIGFSFGGIVFISLATSKISTYYYGEGIIRFFAIQEPEEDPRPILYYWACVHHATRGTTMVLSSINFPKDESNARNSSEYTYLEPTAYPILKWSPENCDEMISVRTLCTERRLSYNQTMDDMEESGFADRSSILRNSSLDTSLLLMVWQKKTARGFRIHGSLFDLNAFYAKRLSGRVVADNTVAKQYPFLSRFSSGEIVYEDPAVDAFGESVLRYPVPASLKKSIDQLFYPSTFHITFNLLTASRFCQMRVLPIQLQLVNNLAENVVDYFNNPSDPSKWICAIGLANSAPAPNMNEERACLLRVLIHTHLPGVLRLIIASAKNSDSLHFIQRWIWREIEIMKTKSDELCAPLFSSIGLSPESCNYVHYTTDLFRSARLILETLCTQIDAFDDQEWKDSLTLQYKASRQVELFSTGISFGLQHKFLPLAGKMLKAHMDCVDSLKRKMSKAKKLGNHLSIHKLVEEIMDICPDESIWNGLNAESWFPPAEFSHFLPVLLLIDVSEEMKISLLGYYFLELDNLAAATGSQTMGLFDSFISHFMRDTYLLSLATQIRQMWFDDVEACEYSYSDDDTAGADSGAGDDETEEELYYLPLSTKQEILYAKSKYMKLKYGVHKFNRDMLKKRRYNLIIQPPPPSSYEMEPEFVVQCREDIVKVRTRFPWLAENIEPLPEYIIQKFRDRVALENREKRDKIVHVPAKESSHISKPRKRKVSDIRNISANMNDSEVFEELPLTMATPAKRQRAVPFNIATPVSAKIWNRVNRVIQTPVSFIDADATKSGKSPTRDCAAPQTPVSILKCNKKQKGGMKSRLRFEVVPQTNIIPSRADALMDETRNGSFTMFSNCNESPLSPTDSPSEAPAPVEFVSMLSDPMTTPVKRQNITLRRERTPTKSPPREIVPAANSPPRERTPSDSPSRETTPMEPSSKETTPTKSPSRETTPTKSTRRDVTPTKSPKKDAKVPKSPRKSTTPANSVHKMLTRSKSPRKPV